MVYSTSQSKFSHFLSGQCGMEIAFLLLLTLPLTAASPLRQTQRSDKEIVLPGAAVEENRSEHMQQQQQQRASLLRIVPFHSEGKQFDMDALKLSMAAKLRPRRAPQRGCHLGTCQLHNLANTLYHIGKTNGKEESKNAKDPQGFGR